MRGEDRNAMLRIAACDDNPLCLNEIESILKKRREWRRLAFTKTRMSY